MTKSSTSNLTYDEVGHLWRDGRWHAALDTQYFVMDERGMADMVRYAVGVARMLTYFTADNVAVRSTEGAGWDAFFGGDISFLLAQMACYQAPELPAASAPAQLEQCLACEFDALMLHYERARQIADMDAPDKLEDGIFGTMKTAVSAELAGILPEDDFAMPVDPAQRLSDVKSSNMPAADVLQTVIRLNERLAKVAARSLASSLSDQSNHPAHAGLFLSFLSLLQDTKTHLNELTERHLVFYYERMLKLHPKPARADRTWLSFELSPKVDHFDLPAGSTFLAPTEPDGTTPTFATDHGLMLTHAKLAQLRAVQMVKGAHHEIGGIRAFPSPLSSDGMGAPLADPAKGSPLFGPANPSPKAISTAQTAASAGVIFASTALNLSEGHRRIKLRLTLRQSAQTDLSKAIAQYRALLAKGHNGPIGDTEFAAMLSDCFVLNCSGKKGPSQLHEFAVDSSAAADNVLGFDITLPQDFPALAPNPKSHIGLPYLTLSLNPAARAFGYQTFGALQIIDATLDVTASELRKVTTGPGASKPISTKPIPPFGASPKVGDDIALSHPDLAGKALNELTLSFNWLGLPPDLSEYYASYELETQNDSFRIGFQISSSDGWQPVLPAGAPSADLDQGVPLFTGVDGVTDLVSHQTWTFDLSDTRLGNKPHLQMVFSAPSYGFGAERYPEIVAATVIENARAKGSVIDKLTGAPPAPKPMPHPPIQPKMGNLRMGFTTRASAQTGDLALFAFKPFGSPQPSPHPSLAPLDFFGRSALYFGFSKLDAGAAVTALFEIVDSPTGQAAASTSDADAKLEWAYLGARGWTALPRQNVSQDETQNLTKTGVIALSAPADAASDPDGLTWFAVTSDARTHLLGQIVGITSQAASVTRVIPEGVDMSGVPALAAGKITKPALPTPQLTKITQTLPTLGGVAAETTRDFRIRVSERLRHKGRAISPRDYEEVVLDAFPDIYEAKCIKAANGVLTLVVAPAAGRVGDGSHPIVSRARRVEIATHLEQLSADWSAQINVINPRYEPVQLRAWVAPHDPVEINGFIHTLEAAFIENLTPWQSDPSCPMAIGAGAVDLAALAARLKSVANVDVVTGMSMTQFYARGGSSVGVAHYGLKDTARLDGDEANTSVVLRPSSPYSVLVPAPRQDLHILPPTRSIGDLAVNRDLYAASPQQRDLWGADSNLIPARPQPVGIGDLSVGHTLIVTTPRDARPWVQPAFLSAKALTAPMMATLPPRPIGQPAKGWSS